MTATDIKTNSNLDFNKYESLGGKKEHLLTNLRNLDTDIRWEELKDLDINAQYDYLKTNGFNINANNPSKNIDSLYSQEYNEQKARASLKAYENSKKEQSLLQDFKDVASSMLEYATGYKNENIKARERALNEVQRDLAKAGITSDKLRGEKLSNYAKEVTLLQRGYANVSDAFTDPFRKKIGIEREHDLRVSAYQTLKTLGDKSYKELTSEQRESIKPIVKESLGIASTLFRDDNEEWELFKDLTRAQEYTQDFISASRKLENILPSAQFLQELWSGESISQKQAQVLKDYEIIADKMGFDALAYNQNGLYFIKQGKVFKVDENFNTMINNAIKDNIGSISLGIAGAIAGFKKGNVKGAIAGGAAGAFLGGVSDTLLTDLVLERGVNIPEMLLHGAQEASFNVAGDLVFLGGGAVVKGIRNKSFLKIKSDDTSEHIKGILGKVGRAIKAQNASAIDRVLANQATKEVRNNNVRAFLNTQSDKLIKDDFKEQSLVNAFSNKLKAYIPLNKLDSIASKDESLKHKQTELLANVLKNKDLADSLSGQLNDVEARILSQAMDKMAKDFKAISGEYENLLAKEVLRDSENPSLPLVFQTLIKNVEKDVKTNYKQAISELSQALEGESLDLFSPFKALADMAISEHGINSDIAKVLMNEVKNLEGRNISIKEALEKRKDLNQILRNFNDNPNTLKKFRIDENMAILKEAIDNTIYNALQSKIAKANKGNKAGQQTAPHAVDNYIQSPEFKALSKDKQEAILSLKYIKPSPIPEDINKEGLENLFNHFNSKADQAQRTEYAKLYKLTQESPDIVLEVSKNGELRQEYIKAFIHKDTKDLYYIAIAKDENIITGIPTTQIKKVINDIARSERVLNAESLQEILNPANLANAQSLAVSKDIIPDYNAIYENFKKANIDYADLKQRLNDKLTKAIFMDKPKASSINSMRSVEEWKKAVLDKKWTESIQGLENTIFARFNPRMQEATQTLLIFRSLERHIKAKDGSNVINLTKALKDIESLEKMPLHPQAQNALNIFKELVSVYQFANKISGAKGFKSGTGNGALSTTLEGRARVFLTNKLFKNLFFRVPYIGDKDAVLHHLKKAINNLKYPRAITLDMLENPKLTSPQTPTPSNPKGEAYINKELSEDIQAFNNAQLSQELDYKVHTTRESQAHKELSEEALKARDEKTTQELRESLQNGKVIFATTGDGRVSQSEIERIKEALNPDSRKPSLAHISKAQALDILKNTKGATIPKEVNISEFLSEVDNFTNKENFIKHLQSRQDAQSRLAYLNLVEPTFKEPDLILSFKEGKEEFIKAFKGENGKINYLLVTKDKGKTLITGIPNVQDRYLKSEINKADIIRPFIPQDRHIQGGGLSSEIKAQKIFNQADINFDSLENFIHYSNLAGIEFKDNAQAKEAYKFIQAHLKELEC